MRWVLWPYFFKLHQSSYSSSIFHRLFSSWLVQIGYYSREISCAEHCAVSWSAIVLISLPIPDSNSNHMLIPATPAMREVGGESHWAVFSSASPHSKGRSLGAPQWWRTAGTCSACLTGQSSPSRETGAPNHEREMTWKNSESAACKSGSKFHPCNGNIEVTQPVGEWSVKPVV